MATTRQIDVWRLHKDVCTFNGHTQKTFLHRATEGRLVPVPGFPSNMEYVSPDARTTDNPVVNTGGTLIWATWEPLHMRASSQDGGDTPAARMWAGQSRIQFPAIDDAFAQITVQDDDFITDDQGFRFNIENPVLSSDGAFWTAIVDKIR